MSSGTTPNVKRLTSLQERFVGSGFKDFNDREVLELFLSLCLPTKGTQRLLKLCLTEFKNIGEFLATSPAELKQLGIPPHAIIRIKLLHELPMEILRKKIIEQPYYRSSQEVFDYLYYSMRDLKNEVLKAIYLNSRNEIIDTVTLFEGTIKNVPIRPREIVEKAIKYGTVSTIFIHNHPSGDPTPSKSDKQFTRDLVFIGELIQISVLDHIVIGGNRYFSFADEGLIEKYRFDFLNFKIRRVSDSKLTSI